MTLLPRLDAEERDRLTRQREEEARAARVTMALAEVERTHSEAYREIAVALEKLRQELGRG